MVVVQIMMGLLLVALRPLCNQKCNKVVIGMFSCPFVPVPCGFVWSVTYFIIQTKEMSTRAHDDTRPEMKFIGGSIQVIIDKLIHWLSMCHVHIDNNIFLLLSTPKSMISYETND